MTGHQPTPAMDTELTGQPYTHIEIEKVVEGLGVKHVQVVKPKNLKKTKEAVEKALAFEPLEALRALRKGNTDTVVITSLSQIQPFTVALGNGEYPAQEKILDLLKAKAKKVVAFDALAKAKSAGNPLGVNMVMLGALMAAGDIPLAEESLRTAIETRTKKAFVEANIKCFDLGMQAAKEASA
jgi:indolepyruvate ferredoxin oxidoreductase beta subunit